MLKKTLAIGIMCAFLAAGSVVPSQASDHGDKCEQHVRKEQDKLEK